MPLIYFTSTFDRTSEIRFDTDVVYVNLFYKNKFKNCISLMNFMYKSRIDNGT